MGDQAVNIIWILGAIVLVGSALLTRRLPRGKILIMTLQWAVVVAALWLSIILIRRYF